MPRCLGRSGFGADGEVDPVGELRARRPDLVAVDDEAVAVVAPLESSARRGRSRRPAPEKPWQKSSSPRAMGRAAAPGAPAPRSARARSRSSCTRGGRARAGASGSRRPPRTSAASTWRRGRGRRAPRARSSRSSRPRRARARDLARVAVREHPLAAPLGIGLEQRRRPPRTRAASSRSARCSSVSRRSTGADPRAVA